MFDVATAQHHQLSQNPSESGTLRLQWRQHHRALRWRWDPAGGSICRGTGSTCTTASMESSLPGKMGNAWCRISTELPCFQMKYGNGIKNWLHNHSIIRNNTVWVHVEHTETHVLLVFVEVKPQWHFCTAREPMLGLNLRLWNEEAESAATGPLTAHSAHSVSVSGSDTDLVDGTAQGKPNEVTNYAWFDSIWTSRWRCQMLPGKYSILE